MSADVVIVGGGVAGLYAAWSLLARGAPVTPGAGAPSVLVVERSDRLGGRIHSVAPPGVESPRAELGAMHYYASQTLVSGLIGELGLASRPFAGGAMDDPADLYYLRGERFTRDELAAGAALPYALAPSERGRPLRELMRAAAGPALGALAGRGPAERRALARSLEIDGRPVADLAERDLMSAGLSPEALTLLAETNGHRGMGAPEVGAVNALFSDAPERRGERTLVDGMQGLPDALAAAVRAAGGRIETGTVALAVRGGADGPPSVVVERAGRRETLTARAVVLALPRRGLQLVDVSGSALGGTGFAADLDAVVPIPAIKVLMAFARPWWRERGIVTGKSITDLPIRECVYLGPPADAAPDAPGLLIASYADWDAEVHWAGIEGDVAEGAPATPELVAAARRQLSELHGLEVPEPTWTGVSDWGADPHGAGWHYWRRGAASLDVAARMRDPAPGSRIHVCGEAFSTAQGWIAGSLGTAERVLREHLGQPAPAWLGADIDLGG